MTDNLLVFAHGKESGPWGTKITHLANIARQRGFEVLSPDYSHTPDPRVRVAQLVEIAPKAKRLVLVGSSMGGYVSALACAALKPDALFLMAPALYFAGWEEEPEGIPQRCTVVHGWHDDIVPLAQAQRFAKRHSAALHILDSGHTLHEQLDLLGLLLDQQLSLVLADKP